MDRKVIAIIALCMFSMSKGWAAETEAFLATLKEHYQATSQIKAFSLKYHFLNRRYRDFNYWDFESPNLYMSQRMVEVDFARQHFYDNDILYYAGGRLSDRVQFQNDTESFYYEKNPTSLGKKVQRRDMNNFDRFTRHIIMNIDFLAVKPLLQETNIADNVRLSRDNDAKTTTITHQLSDDSVVEYQFSLKPLQLISVNHGGMDGVFVYSDYQTTRGMTYARAIDAFYDGATTPTYIKFIDDFNIIEAVDVGKLQLPEGHGPEQVRGDGVLVAKEIADDLHLITDSSEVVNSLVQVNGDQVTVFGGSSSTRLAQQLIEFIPVRFPEKSISAVYVTHPHTHQIAGLALFAEQGAEILADEYTISAIKAFPGFADSIDTFRFNTVVHEQIKNNVQYFVLENMHSKRQSFAWFRDSGVLFQSHFLHIPQDNSIARVVPNYTRSFVDFVRNKQLNIKRIVGNYRNNNISVEVMNKTYDVHQ